MAPTGPGEGGASGPGVLRMRVGDGRRGSGVQNAGALPCPRAFRPSGRVRSDLSSPVAAPPPGSRGCVRRLGEARRPVAASAWCWICGGRFTRCVRESELLGASGGSTRCRERGCFTRCWICGVAPLGAFAGASSSERVWLLDSVPATGRFTRRRVCGRSTRRVREGGLLGARGLRLGAGNGALHSMPGLRVAPLGGFVRADFSARAVFDSVPGTGRFTRRRICGSLRSVGS